MNILLSAAGRRGYLVRYFKDSLGKGDKVIVSNSLPNTSAMVFADGSYITPHAYEKSYIDVLIEIIKKEKIDYLFSLHDLEGPIIAKNIAKINDAGCIPVISNISVINACLDKYHSFEFFKKNNILTPKTWLNPKSALDDIKKIKKISFPLIVKPRFGFGSINQLIVNNKEELLFAFRYIESRKNDQIIDYLGIDKSDSATIIQEYIPGEEYGVEIINDLNGNYITQFQKKKLGMRCGETENAKIVYNKELERVGIIISNKLKHVGILDCDLFIKKGKVYILEMNSRFGGQYPFSHLAGANLPYAIINNFKDYTPKLEIGSIYIKDINLIKK
jgi:carbamoyl-phosphate synthase large subunit